MRHPNNDHWDKTVSLYITHHCLDLQKNKQWTRNTTFLKRNTRENSHWNKQKIYKIEITATKSLHTVLWHVKTWSWEILIIIIWIISVFLGHIWIMFTFKLYTYTMETTCISDHCLQLTPAKMRSAAASASFEFVC